MPPKTIHKGKGKEVVEEKETCEEKLSVCELTLIAVDKLYKLIFIKYEELLESLNERDQHFSESDFFAFQEEVRESLSNVKNVRIRERLEPFVEDIIKFYGKMLKQIEQYNLEIVEYQVLRDSSLLESESVKAQKEEIEKKLKELETEEKRFLSDMRGRRDLIDKTEKELKEKAKELEEKESKLNSDRKFLEGDKEVVSSQQRQIREENLKLNRKRDEIEEKLRTLNQQVDNAKKDYIAKMQELKIIQQNFSLEKSEFETYKQQVREEYERKIIKISEKLRECEESFPQLKEEMYQKAYNDFSSAVGNTPDEISNLRAEHDRLEEENEKLVKKIEEMTTDFENQGKELLQKLNEYEEDLPKLKDEMYDKAYKDFTSEFGKTPNEIADLFSEHEKLEKKHKILQNQKEELVDEIRKMVTQFEKRERELLEKRRELEEKEELYEKLKEELENDKKNFEDRIKNEMVRVKQVLSIGYESDRLEELKKLEERLKRCEQENEEKLRNEMERFNQMERELRGEVEEQRRLNDEELQKVKKNYETQIQLSNVACDGKMLKQQNELENEFEKREEKLRQKLEEQRRLNDEELMEEQSRFELLMHSAREKLDQDKNNFLTQKDRILVQNYLGYLPYEVRNKIVKVNYSEHSITFSQLNIQSNNKEIMINFVGQVTINKPLHQIIVMKPGEGYLYIDYNHIKFTEQKIIKPVDKNYLRLLIAQYLNISSVKNLDKYSELLQNPDFLKFLKEKAQCLYGKDAKCEFYYENTLMSRIVLQD